MTEVVFSPVESHRPGYFIIPGYSKNLISKSGEVIDAETEQVVSQHKSTYMYVYIYSDKLKKKRSIAVHKLMVLAFMGRPRPGQRVTNHKDGVKTNNTVENIEWATYGQNIDHAYRNGLRGDNKPVLVKDIRTDGVVRYHALTEAARAIDMTPAAVCKYLKRFSSKPLGRFFQVKYEDDTTPWPNIDEDVNGFSKDACALNLNTRVVFVAESISALGKLLGINGSTISYAIRTGKQYPVKGYLFKLVEDSTPWNVLSDTTDQK